MNTYAWSATRDLIIETTDDTPYPNQENDIIDVFERRPTEISQEAVKLCRKFEQGVITAVWPILHKYARELDSRRSPTATASPDLETKIHQASQWMRAAGVHFDRWTEVEDELFGHNGRLQPWANDEGIKHEMEMLWINVRPLGEKIEAEAIERAEAWKRYHAKTKDKPKARRQVSKEELLRRARMPGDP